MALPSDKNISPSGMAVASAALVAALFEELINNQTIPRADAERIIATARGDLSRWSTQGAFAEARAFLNILQDNLPKID